MQRRRSFLVLDAQFRPGLKQDANNLLVAMQCRRVQGSGSCVVLGKKLGPVTNQEKRNLITTLTRRGMQRRGSRGVLSRDIRLV